MFPGSNICTDHPDCRNWEGFIPLFHFIAQHLDHSPLHTSLMGSWEHFGVLSLMKSDRTQQKSPQFPVCELGIFSHLGNGHRWFLPRVSDAALRGSVTFVSPNSHMRAHISVHPANLCLPFLLGTKPRVWSSLCHRLGSVMMQEPFVPLSSAQLMTQPRGTVSTGPLCFQTDFFFPLSLCTPDLN